MTTTLRPAVRALVASNMTREEVIREAEHVFAKPTPLIDAMLRHLRGEHVSDAWREGGNTIKSVEGDPAVNCPCCGAQLHIEGT